MKKWLLTGTIALFACCSLIGLAQDGTKPAATKATAADKSDAKSDAKKGRLPANYGKLGLTEAQKTKIYGIQGQYEDQLDSLEKQIEAIKTKRDGEVAAVLTDDQRKILKNLADAAKEAKTKAKPDATPATDGSKASPAATSKEEKK